MKYPLLARTMCGILILVANAACQNPPAESLKLTKIGENIEFEGGSVQLTTRVKGRHTVVTGIIGDQDPLSVIIDTGSGTNVIDRAIAERMGLQKISEREVLSGGVEPMMLDVVIVPELRVDGLRIVNAEFVTLDLETFTMGLHQAIIGLNTFQDALIVFDPQNKMIEVSNGELSKSDPDVLAFEQSDQSKQSIRRIKANVAGIDVWMHIDTGAPTGFIFPIGLSETLPLQGGLQNGPNARLAGGERSIKMGTLDGIVKLGDLEFVNPSVMFMDPSAPQGNIGNAVLDTMVMSIDQKNNLLSLRRSEAPNEAEVVASTNTNKPRRLGIQLRGMGGDALTVSWIEPGSLGAKAGFEEGDTLVRLNNRPMKEYGMPELGALFRGTTPLRFEVERDGELRMIDIQ